MARMLAVLGFVAVLGLAVLAPAAATAGLSGACCFIEKGATCTQTSPSACQQIPGSVYAGDNTGCQSVDCEALLAAAAANQAPAPAASTTALAALSVLLGAGGWHVVRKRRS
ncbi:MAG TPA: hypothetical protein VEB21_04190 [Terriglobales bacterium]|nr:hypothetical protein [Terriglobales bacterium]